MAEKQGGNTMKVKITKEMLLGVMISCLEDADLDKFEHLKAEKKDNKVIFEITTFEDNDENFAAETDTEMEIHI